LYARLSPRLPQELLRELRRIGDAWSRLDAPVATIANVACAWVLDQIDNQVNMLPPLGEGPEHKHDDAPPPGG
jgi:hypothetical protein